MEWTKDKLYRRLEQVPAEELASLKKRVDTCPWRQRFHIQPPTGLLNDPNGLAFYKGEYHFFYQWFPLGAVHGLKYWYHVKSKDLVNWEELGIAIAPNSYYDNYGAYSGSSLEHDGNLYLFYTGNHRDENWQREPMQAIAIMQPNGDIKKLAEPVISKVPAGYTEHFRDPKLWQQGESYYALIGAQRINNTGAAVLYSSKNLLDWVFKGEINTNLPNFGYMWECPDYFELEGKGILIFSPQGLKPVEDNYLNIYQSGYLIGQPLNLETLKFEHGSFYELDRGFDFYAPQSFQDAQGRRILVGWLGLPDIAYPTDRYGWAHCLTLPRELRLINGQLYQSPVVELQRLRKNPSNINAIINGIKKIGEGVHYELLCEFTEIKAKEVGLNLRVGAGEKTVIKYNLAEGKLTLDRSLSGEVFATAYGSMRKIDYQAKSLKLQIFMDTSSLEIFVGDGQQVFTSRIFPTNTQNELQVYTTDGSSVVNISKWEI